MIEVTQKLTHQQSHECTPDYDLCLDYDQRTKGRLKAETSCGEEVGLFLERGKVLRAGDCLKATNGKILRVVAADEELVEASCDSWLIFAKCCYHLGNRHVPLEVGERVLRMRPDHILQEMIEQLGMTTSRVKTGFNPEQGAYSGGHHHHHD